MLLDVESVAGPDERRRVVGPVRSHVIDRSGSSRRITMSWSARHSTCRRRRVRQAVHHQPDAGHRQRVADVAELRFLALPPTVETAIVIRGRAVRPVQAAGGVEGPQQAIRWRTRLHIHAVEKSPAALVITSHRRPAPIT